MFEKKKMQMGHKVEERSLRFTPSVDPVRQKISTAKAIEAKRVLSNRLLNLVASNQIEAALTVASEGGDLSACQEDTGESALHLAAKLGIGKSERAIAMLAKALGIGKVSCTDREGSTALHAAIRARNVKAALLLANLAVEQKEREAYLDSEKTGAIDDDKHNITKIADKKGQTALHLAASLGFSTIVQHLVKVKYLLNIGMDE